MCLESVFIVWFDVNDVSRLIVLVETLMLDVNEVSELDCIECYKLVERK